VVAAQCEEVEEINHRGDGVPPSQMHAAPSSVAGAVSISTACAACPAYLKGDCSTPQLIDVSGTTAGGCGNPDLSW
jgi:hypothetical protein